MHVRRERLVLEVVDDEDSCGFAVPARRNGAPVVRGSGALDYACGRCSGLLAIGVRRGGFDTLLLRCSCGALNRVPAPRRLAAVS